MPHDDSHLRPVALGSDPGPGSLLVIPTFWAVVGTVGALRLGVPEHFGLLIAGAIAASIVFLGNRSTRAAGAA